MIYNLSLSAISLRRGHDSVIVTTNQTLDGDVTTLAQNERIATREEHQRLNLSSRLQWRGEPGEVARAVAVRRSEPGPDAARRRC